MKANQQAGQPAPGPRPRRARHRSAIAASVAVAALMAGCSEGNPAEGAGAAAEVDVATVQLQSVKEWDEFNGRISAVDSVEVRARVSGYIERIAYKEGDMVDKGEILFVIDPRPYRAALDSALALLTRTRATLALAQLQDQRSQRLLQAEAGSREEAETRSANVERGQADLRAAEAAVAVARLNLQFTEVRSPIRGRASRAMLTPGNLVVADQTLLTSVVSQDPVYVYFDPDEHSYLRYRGLPSGGTAAHAYQVRVGLASEQGFPHAGTVNFLDNQVDPGTGSIRVRAILPNKDRVFTPGLYARVRLSGGESQAILVDNKAVLTDQDRMYVYVLGAGNKAIRKEVTLGRDSDGLRVVRTGLKAGDKVIVNGLQRVYYPGASVKPNEVAMGRVPTRADIGGTATIAVE